MDEQKLGEAIGEAISKANAEMIPQFTAVMSQAVLSSQTGVYVEVTPAELAQKLIYRARSLRARAEEVAASPIEIPSIGYVPFYGSDKEAAIREHREQATKLEQQKRKEQIESLKTEAERLDFIAIHLPSAAATIRMDQRELDDLLFRDRRTFHTGSY